MHCCIESCENSIYRTSKNVSFHKFPKSELMTEKWKEILKVQQINEKSLVCSNHFHQTDFTSDKTHRRLFRSAMPCFVEGIQNKQPTIISNLGSQRIANVHVQPQINTFATETERAVQAISLQSHDSETEVVEDDMEVPLSPSSSIESIESADNNFESNNPTDNKMTLKRALYSSDDSCSSSNLSPKGKKLNKELKSLRKRYFKSKRQIKTLNETFRRRSKSIARVNDILFNLKQQQLLQVEVIPTTITPTTTTPTNSRSTTKNVSTVRTKTTATKVKRKRGVKRSKTQKKIQNSANKLKTEERHNDGVLSQSQKPQDPWEDHLMSLITEDEYMAS